MEELKLDDVLQSIVGLVPVPHEPDGACRGDIVDDAQMLLISGRHQHYFIQFGLNSSPKSYHFQAVVI